jgi:NADH:ubiquinone oxidoreductase subunit E
MTLKRKEIRICMGSSCFSRGNKQTLQVIQQYLIDNHLEREVILKGNHCFDHCNSGPVVKIGSRIYEHVTRDNILEILESELGNM